MDIARTVQHVVVGSLVVGAGLTVASIATMPDFTGGFDSRLEAVAASRYATFSAVTWVMSQLFVALGIVGVAHVIRRGAPTLASIGAALVLLSCFGHAVYGGVQLAMLGMADDPEHIGIYSALLDRLQGGVAIPVMAAGMLGLVLGFLVLAVALWRAGVGPRWLGPSLVLWLILEFAGSSLSPWASYASGLLYAAVFATLAVTVARSPLAYWRTEVEARDHSPAPATIAV